MVVERSAWDRLLGGLRSMREQNTQIELSAKEKGKKMLAALRANEATAVQAAGVLIGAPAGAWLAARFLGAKRKKTALVLSVLGTALTVTGAFLRPQYAHYLLGVGSVMSGPATGHAWEHGLKQHEEAEAKKAQPQPATV